jgi:hypothetical protein
MEAVMELRSESITAFALRDFEIGIDAAGYLVMRLTHKPDGAPHRTTYALDFDQGLRFASALVRGAEQAEKFWTRDPKELPLRRRTYN